MVREVLADSKQWSGPCVLELAKTVVFRNGELSYCFLVRESWPGSELRFLEVTRSIAGRCCELM